MSYMFCVSQIFHHCLVCLFLAVRESLWFPTSLHTFWLFSTSLFVFLARPGLVASHGLSLVAASRGYSSLCCTCFSFQCLLLLQSTGSRVHRLQQLWCVGLVAPRHVVFSWRKRNWTHVLCIGRQILNHWTTREVSGYFLSAYCGDHDECQPVTT